jgi:hypothetical protein
MSNAMAAPAASRRRYLAGALLAIAAVAIAAQAASPAPAQAHGCQFSATIHVGGGTGCTFYSGAWTKVCDTQKDGHGVRIQYTLRWPSYQYPVKRTGWAPSGGCHEEGARATGAIAYFRVCIEEEGCTAWKQYDGRDTDVYHLASVNGGCQSYDACSREMFIDKARANEAAQAAILYNIAADQAAARGDLPALFMYRKAAGEKFNEAQLFNIAYENAAEQRSMFCGGCT